METSDGHVSSTNHIPRLLDHRGIRTIYRILNRHWASLLFIGAMVLSITASGISWHTLQEVQKTQKQNCENFLDSRSDLRTLISDVLAAATNEATRVFFQRELNEKFPEGYCDSNNVFQDTNP